MFVLPASPNPSLTSGHCCLYPYDHYWPVGVSRILKLVFPMLMLLLVSRSIIESDSHFSSWYMFDSQSQRLDNSCFEIPFHFFRFHCTCCKSSRMISYVLVRTCVCAFIWTTHVFNFYLLLICDSHVIFSCMVWIRNDFPCLRAGNALAKADRYFLAFAYFSQKWWSLFMQDMVISFAECWVR